MVTATAEGAQHTVHRQSVLFRLAVEQYVRHSPLAYADRCAACRARPCPVQRHAAEVIAAAGIDPAAYEPPPRRPLAVHWAYTATQHLPTLPTPGRN